MVRICVAMALHSLDIAALSSIFLQVHSGTQSEHDQTVFHRVECRIMDQLKTGCDGEHVIDLPAVEEFGCRLGVVTVTEWLRLGWCGSFR